MPIRKSKDDPTGLEKAINELLANLDYHQPETEEYAQMVDQLSKLYSLKHIDASPRVSPDTLVTVGAHLLGIVLIVGRERLHVISSKALQFVVKLI